MNEKRTIRRSGLKSAVGFILKVILALVSVTVIAAIAMEFFPQPGDMREVIRNNWFNLLLWRLMLYAALAGLLFKLRNRFTGPRYRQLIRLFITLAAVTEAANIIQLLQG